MATEFTINVAQLGLTPEELAALFTELNGDQQAQFFATVWDIAKAWPGAGWCQQSYDIAKFADANPGCRDAITTLAAHFEVEAA